MTIRNRESNGRFRRTRTSWTPENWDDGFIDNRGRFRVFRPDCPRSYEGGYALRAHVVWWLATGSVHPLGTNLHHVNEDRLDDRYENLRCLPHGEHSSHHSLSLHKFTCSHCGNEFTRNGSEVSKRLYEGRIPKFCSQACYHAHPRSPESLEKTASSMRAAWRTGKHPRAR